MRKTMRLEACVATAERGAVLMDAPFATVDAATRVNAQLGCNDRPFYRLAPQLGALIRLPPQGFEDPAYTMHEVFLQWVSN